MNYRFAFFMFLEQQENSKKMDGMYLGLSIGFIMILGFFDAWIWDYRDRLIHHRLNGLPEPPIDFFLVRILQCVISIVSRALKIFLTSWNGKNINTQLTTLQRNRSIMRCYISGTSSRLIIADGMSVQNLVWHLLTNNIKSSSRLFWFSA